MVDDGAQNRIALSSGANASVGTEDIGRLRSALATARIVSLQLEVPIAAVCKAAAIAHAAGCTVVLNPAPAQPLPDTLLPLVGILVVNEIEAAMLSGMTVSDMVSAARAAAALRRRGPAHVILTMGACGVVVANAEGIRGFEALSVRAVDTTAAGDTFIGALCAALAKKASFDACIALGIQTDALSVTKAGAQVSMPHRQDLAALPAVPRPSPVG